MSDIKNKTTIQNGKGSSPRNNLSKRFRDNYDSINWGEKSKNNKTKGKNK